MRKHVRDGQTKLQGGKFEYTCSIFYMVCDTLSFRQPRYAYMSKKTPKVDATGNFAKPCLRNYRYAPSHGSPRRHCTAQLTRWKQLLESYFISFSRRFSSFVQSNRRIFSLCGKEKASSVSQTRACTAAEAGMWKTGLYPVTGGAAKICVAGLTSDPH